jgi:caffeoyl-CoA O-methyltransferase
MHGVLPQGRTRFLQKRECCAGGLEGRLIATLCALSGAKTVLEVGMFTGTTTLAVAQALPADGRVRLLTNAQQH